MLEEVSRAARGNPWPLLSFLSCGKRHERRASRMTIRFTEGDAIPDDVLGFVEDLLRMAVADFQSVSSAIANGRFAEAKGARRVPRDLVSVGLLLAQERAKVDKLRKQVAGSVGAGSELDLWAARDEIGRRLACLRAARGD
jgi:hypothetical protein